MAVHWRSMLDACRANLNNGGACKCDKLSMRRWEKAHGFIYAYQCQTCGRRVGNWVKKADAITKHGNEIQVADAEVAHRLDERRQAETDDRREAWQKVYREYLASQEWKARRALVLKRADNMCEGCMIAPATQVHHLTYDNAGAELLFELVAICAECHERVHG